jgi:hypothetical protein
MAASVNAMAQQNQQQAQKNTPPTSPAPAPSNPAPAEDPVAAAIATMAKTMEEIADKKDFLDKNMVPVEEQREILEPMFERHEAARAVVTSNIVGIQGKPASHPFSEKNPAMQAIGRLPGAQALAAKDDAKVAAREAIGQPMGWAAKAFSAARTVLGPLAMQAMSQAIVAESYNSSFGFGR